MSSNMYKINKKKLTIVNVFTIICTAIDVVAKVCKLWAAYVASFSSQIILNVHRYMNL